MTKKRPVHVDTSWLIIELDGLRGALAIGAYMKLMLFYFQRGSLPADDVLLANYADVTEEEWTKIRHIILSRFIPRSDGEYRNQKLDEVLEQATYISETRSRASGQRAANKRSQHLRPVT